MFYRGFHIDIVNEHIGYQIRLKGKLIYTAATEDRACEWIDDCISATSLAMELAI